MKRRIGFVVGVMMVLSVWGAIVLAGMYSSGWGQAVTVTTTPQQITGFEANLVSIYNSESTNAVVYAAINATTGTLATAIAATNALCIPGGTSWTFDGRSKVIFTSVSLQSASGSPLVYVAAY